MLFPLGARGAVGLPAEVCSSLHSNGKCPQPPHRKQCERCRFLGELDELSCGKLRFVGDEDETGTVRVTGRVLMMVSAARSKIARSWDGLSATASRCWISYSIAMSQLWERPRSITSLWCWAKASARTSPWWKRIRSSAAWAAACQSTVEIDLSLRRSRALTVRPPLALRMKSSSPRAALSRAAEVNKEYGT